MPGLSYFPPDTTEQAKESTKESPKETPAQDWKPKVVRTGTNIPLVGAEERMAYVLATPPPAGATFRWEHHLDYPDRGAAGIQAGGWAYEYLVSPKVEGLAKGTVEIGMNDDDATTVVSREMFMTPKPMFRVDRLRSAPNPNHFDKRAAQLRGELPVIDEMQEFEDLYLYLHCDNIVVPGEITVTGGGALMYLGHQQVADKLIRVSMRVLSGVVGQTIQPLLVMPFTSPYPIAGMPQVKILPMADIHDFGKDQDKGKTGRPLNSDDALGRIFSEMAQTFRDINTATHVIVDQSHAIDPEPEKPFSVELLEGILTVAAGAMSAGIGAFVVRSLKNEGVKEFAKVVIEQTLNAGTSGALASLRSDLRAGSAKSMLVSARFLETRDAWTAAAQKYYETAERTELMSRVREADDRVPGSGMEMAMSVAKTIDATRSTIIDIQKQKALETYLSMVASETTHSWANGQRARIQMSTLAPSDQKNGSGSDISMATSAYYTEMRGGAGEQKNAPVSGTDGLLRLELVRNPSASKYGLEIASAAMHGINEGLRDRLAGAIVSELELPIIAKSTEPPWTIGRDVSGEYVAIQSDVNHVGELTNMKDPRESAKAIFQSLGKLPKPNNS